MTPEPNPNDDNDGDSSNNSGWDLSDIDSETDDNLPQRKEENTESDDSKEEETLPEKREASDDEEETLPEKREEVTDIEKYGDDLDPKFVFSMFREGVADAINLETHLAKWFYENWDDLSEEQKGAAYDLFDHERSTIGAEDLFDHAQSDEDADELFDHDKSTEGAQSSDEFSDFSEQTWEPDEAEGFDYDATETEADEPQTEFISESETSFGKIDVNDLLDDPPKGLKREGYDEFPGYVEEKRYWLHKPYSYAVILRSKEDKNRIYHIVEPELDDYERILKRELGERLRDLLRYEEIPEYEGMTKLAAREKVLRNKILDVVSEYGISKDSESLHKVLYYVERDFIRYGKIDPIMNDPYVEDISCNGYEYPIYVYHREYGTNLESNVTFEKQELNSFVIRLAQKSGKHISTASPQVDASLPDGSRAQLTFGEDVTTRGSSFTIRQFQDVPLTPVDLVDLGTFSVQQMAYFWLAIENRKSLIFAGGTASGKTTSMNAISLFIPPKSKIVSIEDTRELTLPHENWVPSVTRQKFGGSFGGEEGGGKGEVTMFKLLRAALRQRPEYLLVGEVRGSEANTLFQAMSTGHTTYSTFHANDVDSVIQRLTNEPISVPRTMLKSLDIISIQTQRDVDNESVRRNVNISEVGGLDEDNNLQTYSYYEYDARNDTFTQTGNSRVLREIAEKKGWEGERLQEELEERQRLLQYMIDNNIRGYRAVTRVLQAYMVDPDRITDMMDEGTLTSEELQRLDSVV